MTERDYGLCRYCGAKVILTAEAREYWRTSNEILRRRHTDALGVDEVTVCREHLTKWRCEMQEKSAREIKRRVAQERAAAKRRGDVGDELE